MHETHISFYLKANRIRIFVDALRGIGSPSRICFMIEESGETLLVAPYGKRDFRSHAVPPEVYGGTGGMEVSSAQGMGTTVTRTIPAIHLTRQEEV